MEAVMAAKVVMEDKVVMVEKAAMEVVDVVVVMEVIKLNLETKRKCKHIGPRLRLQKQIITIHM